MPVPVAQKVKCPACPRRIDVRGIKAHMRTHGTETVNIPKKLPQSVPGTLVEFREGYRTGWMDAQQKLAA